MNTRFSPTLNRELHIGNLYNLYFNIYLAEKFGGSCFFLPEIEEDAPDDIAEEAIDFIGEILNLSQWVFIPKGSVKVKAIVHKLLSIGGIGRGRDLERVTAENADLHDFDKYYRFKYCKDFRVWYHPLLVDDAGKLSKSSSPCVVFLKRLSGKYNLSGSRLKNTLDMFFTWLMIGILDSNNERRQEKRVKLFSELSVCSMQDTVFCEDDFAYCAEVS